MDALTQKPNYITNHTLYALSSTALYISCGVITMRENRTQMIVEVNKVILTAGLRISGLQDKNNKKDRLPGVVPKNVLQRLN